MKILLYFFLLICCYTDIKERRVRNAVVVPALLAGLFYNLYSGGAAGLIFSLKGFSAGFAMIFFTVLIGVAGAGDLKFLCTVGAMAGPGTAVWGAFYGAAMAAVFGVGLMLYRGCLISNLYFSIDQAVRIFNGLARGKVYTPGVSDDVTVPFAAFLSAGTFIAFNLGGLI
ncbi:MAG: prepilin peptidase [Bacillota bacterium]